MTSLITTLKLLSYSVTTSQPVALTPEHCQELQIYIDSLLSAIDPPVKVKGQTQVPPAHYPLPLDRVLLTVSEQ